MNAPLKHGPRPACSGGVRLGESGSSLLSTMVSIGIMGVVTLTTMTFLSNTMKSTWHVEEETDLQLIRQSIVNSLDCAKTLEAFAAKPVPVCSPADGWLDLRMKDNAGVARYIMKKDPTAKGLLAGSGSISGKWYARARCGADSLEIQVAKTKRTPDLEFAESKLKGTLLDFNARKHKLFGDGAGALKICAEHFNAAATGLKLAPIKLVKAFSVGCDSAAGNECYCGNLDVLHRQTTNNPTGSPYLHGALSPAGTERPRFWRGVVDCGSGRHLAMASADCGSVAGGGMLANVFLMDERRAEVSCCAYTSDGIANGQTSANVVKAICKDD